MTNIRTGFAWLDKLMPEGIGLYTSTMISGPGGSGKPLVGNAFASAWLKEGGSVVFMSLQYPSTDFIFSGIAALQAVDLNQYLDHVKFIVLDPTIDNMQSSGKEIKANLVKPEIWEMAIEKACSQVPDKGPGILVFGSALNLLLFSPTYGSSIKQKMQNTISEDKTRSYLFSVSTSAKKEQVSQLEDAADNLILTRSTKEPEFRLYLSITRLKNVQFSSEEIQVPIPAQALGEVRAVAEHSRNRVIPLISKI
ncbi:MAG: ATPase domain-containing protein [Candidatus Bipolaricaulota bacterium]|nr:ATPase domain-containing protein [Candidatus Bipolaricaulota bacterium]